MIRRAFLTVLLLISFPLIASHIVGGEFELIHISGNLYRLNLIIYYDVLNAATGTKDGNATVSIYRKRDKAFMSNLVLPLSGESNVPYTQPECSKGEIVTSKLLYTSTLILSPEIYNDPEGYFVVWQRCCRNYTITNIYSQVPGGSNIAAGQTFYLEFPPVVKNGEPFINSSPRLFPPLNDYACPFRPYYVDFAGIDDDGDSLVYSMVTPLNTTAEVALPPPSPGPYPEVRWRLGYGINNIINGKPDLKISTDGLLTATPRTQGLFVFAVKIEEFREGKKIGESRRDFQMLVVDACPQAEPPKIMGKKLTDTEFKYSEKMDITFTGLVADADRCIQVRVSDPDASKPEDNFSEKISIRAVSLNFKKNVNEILPAVKTATLTHGSTVDFNICFPQCPFIDEGPYEIGIIAFDDACSLPLSDTLRVTVNVQPPPNTPPYFVKPTLTVTPVTLSEGGFYESDFEIRDDENDELFVFITTDGFVLADAGITVTIDEPRVNGKVTGKIRWDAFCDIFDFTQRTQFQVNISVNDNDLCDDEQRVTATYQFTVVLPGNADPVIDTDLTPDPSERRVLNIQRRIFETLSFTVTGKDLTDNDLLVLDVKQRDSLSLLGISFPKVSSNGTVSSLFRWDLSCTSVDISKKDKFVFQFIVVDNSNKCQIYKADTVDVHVKILPPVNTAPVLTIQQGTTWVTDQSVSITLGQPIRFDIIGTDSDLSPDKDLLKLTLLEAKGNVTPEGFTFTSAEGRGRVESVLAWSPDCSVFKNDVYENTYTFKFRVADDRCFAIKADTATLTLHLKDVDNASRAFLPPNVFTPNGDGCNDYFALEGIEPCPYNPDPDYNPDAFISLPPDNCVRRFESIHIYNRWGNEVFRSYDRKFRWYAPDAAAGVYYYLIKYTDREYKSSLSVRF
jgi:hypothetical protein